MRFEFEQYKRSHAVALGFMVGWEDWHLRLITFKVDLFTRGFVFGIYLRGGK